jgi:hypothetical protein
MKMLMRKGVGQLIYSYSKKFADELQVSVDTAGFRIAGVAALPFTKNYKYGGFTWRGIIEMSNGMNNGLSDYVLSKEENIDDFHTRINFTPPPIYRKFLAKKGSVEEHPLIKYALENEIPKGMRNNYMWFSIKMLLRDSNIDFASPEFKALHKKLEKRWNDELASNVPDKKFLFSETTVNQFCIKNKVPLVYPYMAYRKKKQDMKLDDIDFEMMSATDKTMRLDSQTEILDDMKIAKETMVEGDYDNIIRMGAFIRGCIKKYGEQNTAYYVKYLFPRFFNYE